MELIYLINIYVVISGNLDYDSVTKFIICFKIRVEILEKMFGQEVTEIVCTCLVEGKVISSYISLPCFVSFPLFSFHFSFF